MIGIIGLIAFFTALVLSLVVTRLAADALALTGLSREAANFQARSAFTGTGFTTSESEQVVNHPVRRRIVMLLMVARSAGLVTIIISLILSFAGAQGGAVMLKRVLFMAAGVVVLWLLARSRIVDRYLSRAIEWALSRWTDLDTRDYVSLLKLSDEYTVKELRVREGEWLAGKTLKDCRLPDEGVNVLGIYRNDGSYVGVPSADTEVFPDDTLILYGRARALRELDRRRADITGDEAHERAVREHRRHKAQQEIKDKEHKKMREEKEAGEPSPAETEAGG